MHARMPKSCPFHKVRSATDIASRLRFDAVCRRRLVRGLGAEMVKALDALLGAYDA